MSTKARAREIAETLSRSSGKGVALDMTLYYHPSNDQLTLYVKRPKGSERASASFLLGCGTEREEYATDRFGELIEAFWEHHQGVKV